MYKNATIIKICGDFVPILRIEYGNLERPNRNLSKLMDYADNQQMQVRWQAFLHQIIKSENIMFADDVVYIQNELRPYWEKLSHE